ncbi:CGNR zinc finger domain-containing protein [Actinoplanes sp. GCM10030250]|uniref:CGNR zinc finger domain-containing protein n=1 Tax=Actinoplanes sp. GCM10030250 TaxID=3273376 RepID=UPI00361F38EB
MVVAMALINALAVEHAHGRPVGPVEPGPAIAGILAIDPPSAAAFRSGDSPGFTELARQLRQIVDDLDRGDVDAAAGRLNTFLVEHPAHPHLAKEDGRWRLHHHPADAALVPMWTSICAASIARLVGAGLHDRVGTCHAPGCDLAFIDASKNGSRRFCSTPCQNRVKAATFRRRAQTR